MPGRRRPSAAVAPPAVLLLAGCWFGTESYGACVTSYEESSAAAAAWLGAAEPAAPVEVSYGFCGDGRRVERAFAALNALGYAVAPPANHFEVPGAHCTIARRTAAAADLDPAAELGRICRIAEAARSVVTGGTFAREGAEPFRLEDLPSLRRAGLR